MHRWYNKNLKLILDITTYCNAKCPQCSRTNSIDGGLEREKYVPLVHWSLPEVQLAYPKEELKNVDYVAFSPTWGDPMMNPNVYEIMDHFLDALPNYSSLQINTNGSMRDENFWWRFGALAIKYPKKIFKVSFDIDGIDQEMHAKYRRNTNLQKVLDNMLAFSDNGVSNTVSQTILFKHNQNYMEEIKTLVKKYGSRSHQFVKSDRFRLDENETFKPFKFLNENGEKEILEWADKPLENAYLAHYKNNQDIQEEIVCKWALDNILNINFDGQVWPCCYFGSRDYSLISEKFNEEEVIKEYNILRFDNNVKFTPLTKIIENSWYTETLQKSIKNDPLEVCTKHCSTRMRSFDKQQVRTKEKL